MNIHEYRFLLSEQGTLERLISRTSPGNVIGRMSLGSRLRQVKAELEAYEGFSPHQVNARLTFRGRPVVSNRGIFADFGTEAVNGFAEAVTRIGAGWNSPLPASGRIPNSAEYRLLITGTATGSFGFQVEDASQQPILIGESSPVELAIDRFKGILDASTKTDDELVEAIADTDRRALDAVRDFLKLMADNRATCALEFQGSEFRFTDVAQVRRSERRLSNDNILEEDVTLEGQFQGFLPHSRRAEFLIAQTDADFLAGAVGTVVSGRVEAAVGDTANINEILNQDVTITARVKRVGQGRPRYVVTQVVNPNL